MKRSEMVKIIQLELHKRMGSYVGGSLIPMADKILSKIESRGMLPPWTSGYGYLDECYWEDEQSESDERGTSE